ncbi:hypothetical protein [Desulfopila sp. IMCC35008]|uniref:hypothetical protein n=1 Tax=Desulfopila sp. IMCC35008 TaxID=2653858 RepID=UPI0013D26EFE|nr:hypothetical protein [Desulfopila sp. IMCC35008]
MQQENERSENMKTGMLVLRAILIVAVMFIAGCGGKNYKEGSETADSIQDVEQETNPDRLRTG